MKREIERIFDGSDFKLIVYKHGFELQVMKPDAKMCCDYESYQHWEDYDGIECSELEALESWKDEEDFIAMEKAGFFGEVK